MEPLRRFVDADNSCLFSSIGYLLDNDQFSETTKLQYRQILATYIQDNIFEAGLFEISKEDYVQNIVNPSTWGGAIELKIFSDIYQIEIASIDVMTNRVDIFGQDKNYKNRIYVLYNGVHYDPLVFASGDDTTEDLRVFDANDNETLILFQNYVKIFKDAGDFVDLANMNKFECMQCTTLFENQEEAFEHAQNYEHWNFKELDN